ncbi:tRNA lysidine(34) synthetase TilS [Pelagibacterales bacterium]|nr:tRNA lysidine(34) synthetase TilS [Pelagibacterales bacterium]
MVVKLAKPKKSRNFDPILENDFFNSLLKFKINESIAVAVSGGPDSLALTILLKKFSIKNNIELRALSIDHDLRSSSKDELKWLASELKEKKIKHKIIKWKNLKPNSNILSNARDKRYELLLKECERLNIRYLFTGHHLDDQVENVLLRLIRGSGIKGLGSLQEQFKFTKSKVNILRPLLRYPKKSLISFLATEKQKYILDPTNFDSKFDRSRVRKVSSHLINEGLNNRRLLSTIKNLKNANNSINYLINSSLKSFVKVNSRGIIFILLERFVLLPEEVKFRSLSKLLKFVGKGKSTPRSKNILNILSSISENNFKNLTTAGCLIKKKNKQIFILPEVTRKLSTTKITSNNFIWNDQYKIIMENDFAKGLSVQYLGANGLMSLPKKYNDKLMKDLYPASYLSLWKGKKLVAVPDVNYLIKDIRSIKKYALIDIHPYLMER